MIEINLTISTQVRDGISISVAQSVTADAYDTIEVVIPGGDTTTPGTATVEVQPGGVGQVKFLLIRASEYSDKLTYTISGGASNVKLDAPHILVGEGAVGLLGSAPQELEFSNTLGVGKNVSIAILVARKATT
jgi:hypothetical protein